MVNRVVIVRKNFREWCKMAMWKIVKVSLALAL
jgi:hypothetical protein